MMIDRGRFGFFQMRRAAATELTVVHQVAEQVSSFGRIATASA